MEWIKKLFNRPKPETKDSLQVEDEINIILEELSELCVKNNVNYSACVCLKEDKFIGSWHINEDYAGAKILYTTIGVMAPHAIDPKKV